jgi:type IV pilus assembly protein PilN
MVRINLLPVRVSKKKEAGKQQLALLALILLGGIGLNVSYNMSGYAALERVEKDVGRARAKVAELDKIIGEVNKIGQQQEELKKKLDVLTKLKEGRTGPVHMLDELATVTPKKLWFRKMEEKAGKITFTGTASTIDDVSQFIRALKDSKYFTDVELKKTEGKVTGPFRVVEFVVNATARYNEAPVGGDAKGGKGVAARKAGG